MTPQVHPDPVELVEIAPDKHGKRYSLADPDLIAKLKEMYNM